jgi:hypothetical protein
VHARLSLLVTTILAAAALGGCADGKVEESNAYVAAVNDAQTAFTATSERLQQEIVPGKTQANRGAFDEFYGAVDDFVDRLRAIEAPASVRALHERLIATMERFGDSLRSAGGKITSGTASRILDGQEELAEASGAVAKGLNATITAINDALQG